MARAKGKGLPLQCKYTLFQAPDGNYYMVPRKGEVIPVANKDEVTNVLKDFDQLMTDVIGPQNRMVAGSGVHIQIPNLG